MILVCYWMSRRLSGEAAHQGECEPLANFSVTFCSCWEEGQAQPPVLPRVSKPSTTWWKTRPPGITPPSRPSVSPSYALVQMTDSVPPLQPLRCPAQTLCAAQHRPPFLATGRWWGWTLSANRRRGCSLPVRRLPGARGLQQAHRCPSCFISLAAWKTFPLGSARTSQPVFHAPPFLPIAPLLANHRERGCSGVSGRPPALFSPLTPASPVTSPLSAVTLLPRSPLRRAPSPGTHLRASVPVLVAPLPFLCVLSPGSSRPELLSATYTPMTCTSVSSPASSPEPRAPGPTPRQHQEADSYSTLHTHLKLRHTLSPLLSRQLLVLQFPPPQYMAP